MSTSADLASHAFEHPNEPLEFLLISDQIDSSAVSVDAVSRQIKEHFSRLPAAIFSVAGVSEKTSVIKSVGDSLMMSVVCEAYALCDLLTAILDVKDELAQLSEGSIGLRILLIRLMHHGHEYHKGEALSLNGAKISGNFRDLSGKHKNLGGWVRGDVFGPRVNLAYRATSLSIKQPLLVIHESVAELLVPRGTLGKHPFAIGGEGAIRIGPAKAFSPIPGLEANYPFATVRGEDWPGHLFLRSVTNSRAEFDVMDELSLEQEKFKCFVRFMWHGDPDEGDRDNWLRVLQYLQGSASYFREIMFVEREVELYRTKDKFGHLTSVSLADWSDMRTGMIAAFAAPFESTYELLRKKIFDQQKLRDASSGFRYPISTIIYNHATEQEAPFPGIANGTDLPNRQVVIYWRWKPDCRTVDESPYQRLVDDIAAACRVFGLKRRRRKGMIVGGEWDGYAIFDVKQEACEVGEGIEGHLQTSNGTTDSFSNIVTRLLALPKVSDVEAMAIFLCTSPVSQTQLVDRYYDSTNSLSAAI